MCVYYFKKDEPSMLQGNYFEILQNILENTKYVYISVQILSTLSVFLKYL